MRPPASRAVPYLLSCPCTVFSRFKLSHNTIMSSIMNLINFKSDLNSRTSNDSWEKIDVVTLWATRESALIIIYVFLTWAFYGKRSLCIYLECL